MATKAQIEANHRNAQKSTGPKTPEGKARVALNALKHGIRANALVASLQHLPLFDDDPQVFADHVQALVDHFQPEGPIEEACVEDIAICQWRLRRIVCAETGHIASAQTILLSGPGADNPRLRARNGLPYFEDLEKLNRYEISIQRQFKRSLDTLTALIRERRSDCGQVNSGVQAKQKADRESEIARIRGEVLGYLLDEFSSGDNDPESVILSEEGPNKSNIEPALATIDESRNLTEQSQRPSNEPDALTGTLPSTRCIGPDPSTATACSFAAGICPSVEGRQAASQGRLNPESNLSTPKARAARPFNLGNDPLAAENGNLTKQSQLPPNGLEASPSTEGTLPSTEGPNKPNPLPESMVAGCRPPTYPNEADLPIHR